MDFLLRTPSLPIYRTAQALVGLVTFFYYPAALLVFAVIAIPVLIIDRIHGGRGGGMLSLMNKVGLWIPQTFSLRDDQFAIIKRPSWNMGQRIHGPGYFVTLPYTSIRWIGTNTEFENIDPLAQ